MSREAANIIAAGVIKKPSLVLGLATGKTPMGCYRELVEMYRKGKLDFKGVTTFNLDEYVGLDEKHPPSYHSVMWGNIFKFVNIPPENIHIPDGNTKSIEKFVLEYETAIKKARGIDIQLLGMGPEGHIGFNFPYTLFDSRMHLVKLNRETLKANSEFFKGEKVPKYAITMGIGTIMEAKKILLLVSGEKKADLVAKALEGPIDIEVPASILQKHPNVTIILDREAASRLKGYY